MGLLAPRRLHAAALGLALALQVGERPAAAHAIESTLERVSGLNDALVLQSRFGPDQPASDAAVRLVSPSGEATALGRTDASGTLRFRIPRGAGPGWELQVDQGPGHRDYLELPAHASQAIGLSAGRLSAPERLLRRAGDVLRQPQPLLLAGLVALGGLGGAVLWRRRLR